MPYSLEKNTWKGITRRDFALWVIIAAIASSIPNIVSAQEKKKIERTPEDIERDYATTHYLLNLNKLWRLWHNRDLDRLFDGETDEEDELFAIYSIIEILNWKTYITPWFEPKSMYLDRKPLAQNYTYTFEYEDIEIPWKWKMKRIKKLISDGNLPFNECILTFEYNTLWEVTKIHFNRPRLSFSQEIVPERDATTKKVTHINVWRTLKFDNKVSLAYNEKWLVAEVKQTKLHALKDIMKLWYTPDWEINEIHFQPSMSFRDIRGEKWTDKIISFGFQWLKKSKWTDVVEVQYKDGKIAWEKSNLWASYWFFTWNKWQYSYDEQGRITSMNRSRNYYFSIWATRSLSVEY